MPLHSAPSRSSSECRTMLQEPFIKHQDDHTHTHCYRICTGCWWSSASPASWPCWHSRYGKRQHWHISVATSLKAAVIVGHYVPRRSLQTWANHPLAAPTTRNSLPPSVVSCDTFSVFKSRLKTQLFNIAFSYITCSASASEAMSLWCSTDVLLLLFFKPSVLNSRRYEILKTKQVRPQLHLLGGESAVKGDCISPLKSHWHLLEQVSRFPDVFSDGCHSSAQLLH